MTTTVRFVERDGGITDIRSKDKAAARLAARLNNDAACHGPGWAPHFRAVFVLSSDELPLNQTARYTEPARYGL